MMAARLAATRKAFLPSAIDVAQILNVPAQVLNSYEKARNFPSELFLVRFCALTKANFDWLYLGPVGMESNMPPELSAAIALHFPDEAKAALDGTLTSTAPSQTAAELRAAMARRLRIARTAFSLTRPDSQENLRSRSGVAAALGIGRKVMDAYEVGRNFPDEAFLVRFYELTKCPICWIMLGRMSARMPKDLCARIALVAPKLVGGPEEAAALVRAL